MSVLEDINTESGLGIREASMNVCYKDARHFMDIIKKKNMYRMDEIEYSEVRSTLTQTTLSKCSHHWIEGNTAKWGLPGGTFSDFIDRIQGYAEDWDNEAWVPCVDRETNEPRARDLLLASYLFPFSMSPTKFIMKHAIMPIIASSKLVKSGCSATASILVDVMERGNAFSAMEDLFGEIKQSEADKMTEFDSFMTMFETVTSSNPGDAQNAGRKVRHRIDTSDREALRYTRIAHLANLLDKVRRSSAPKGQLGRNTKKVESQYRNLAKQDTAYWTEHDQKVHKQESSRLSKSIYREFVSNVNIARASPVYRTRAAPAVKIIACGNLVLARFSSMSPLYIFTSEDIKNLRFVSMTHSMWHFHASSLAVEYAPPLVKVENKVVEKAEMFGQLGITSLTQLSRSLGLGEMPITQKVATYGECKEKLTLMWRFYCKIIKRMESCGMPDAAGKYLNDIFSVMTSYLAGYMAKDGMDAQEADFYNDWRGYDVPARSDLSTMKEICEHLPMTLFQDFGRLAKIVYAYDINGTYSFIARVNKMHKMNPRGVATFTSGVEFTLADQTLGEAEVSMNKFKCASVCLLAMGDLRKHTAAMLSEEQREEIEDMPWINLIDYFKMHNIHQKGNSKLLDEPYYPVPAEEDDRAREQAAEFYQSGISPKSVWAGAYMDIDNMEVYKELGEVDISILKSSSCAPSEEKRALSGRGTQMRMTPVRDTDNNRRQVGGDMITEYLKERFPSRTEAINWVKTNRVILSCSVKIETSKWPLKNRIITSACLEARRVMSEYEFNNGRSLSSVPGYTVGVDPAVVKRKLYSAMRDDVMPGMKRLFISLDLSSWSTGMHWDIQEASNSVMARLYDGGQDAMSSLEDCTKETLMIYAQKNVRLATVNSRGANYEGLDGKRNTFIHCALWFMSRCDAFAKGVPGSMRALLFIDDGTAIIDLPVEQYESCALTLRRSIISTYMEFGFAISVMKTVVSAVYCQFLNEIYFHGAHIGYGFRALCHTGAQTFHEGLTVREELSVITSGIRGAALSGGHPIRLLSGYHRLLHLYITGVIGTKGTSLNVGGPAARALTLMLPSIAYGFNLPNATELLSNLAGNRDIEKLSSIPKLVNMFKEVSRNAYENLRALTTAGLLMPSLVKKTDVPNRVTMKHPCTTLISSRNRDMLIAKGAANCATNPSAEMLIRRYMNAPNNRESFPAAFTEAVKQANVKIPLVIYEKALGADPDRTLATLIKKITSSALIKNFIKPDDFRRLKSSYFYDARQRIMSVSKAISQ